MTVLVMGAAAQAGRSAEPDRWVEIFCSLVAIVEAVSAVVAGNWAGCSGG